MIDVYSSKVSWPTCPLMSKDSVYKAFTVKFDVNQLESIEVNQSWSESAFNLAETFY